MRFISLVVVHYSATRCDRSYMKHDLTTDRLCQGFSDAGCHFYIRRDGGTKTLRPIGQPGTHVKNRSTHSVDVCYESGFNERGHSANTRTNSQKHSLWVLVMLLLRGYSGSHPYGRRDLSPDPGCDDEIEPKEWIKAYPCFGMASILQDSVPPNPAYL